MRLLVLIILFCSTAEAQIDSALTIPLVTMNFGGQVPSADMAERFGPNLKAGGTFLIKTRKNFIYGLESHYMFGRNVKEDVLSQLKTSDGYVTDNEGYPGDLRVTERALNIHFVFGKVLQVGNVNPNSGLMITAGIGYLQHKVNLYDAQQRIAAVKGNLRHGYDRLSTGFSTSIFVGYLFLSDNRLLNFYFGFESYQGFTKSIRKMNYDTGMADTAPRIDILSGFRIGWILPLYKKQPNDFYYY